ncbi:MAG: S41 family peptidase, partial [Tissierellia bacterium]|nr:S41 family peptidase [Tissierellia bacterium]
MSKKKTVTFVVVLLIISNILTFGLTNMVTIKTKDKVTVPRKEYEELSAAYEKYAKALNLEAYVKENYLREVSEEQIFEGQLKGIFQALEDPYSVYMTQDEFKDFTEHTKGVYGGIGVIVTPGDDNLITVV